MHNSLQMRRADRTDVADANRIAEVALEPTTGPSDVDVEVGNTLDVDDTRHGAIPTSQSYVFGPSSPAHASRTNAMYFADSPSTSNVYS